MAKKRTEWDEKETQYLIEVWQNNVQDLRRTKRNSKVYATMAQELKALGVKKDPKEIMNKTKNLTKKYRDEKKIIGPSGGSPSPWKYFDQVNNILGSFATNDDSLLIETTFYANDSDSSNSLLSPPQLSPQLLSSQLLSPSPISSEQDFLDFSTSPEQQSFSKPSTSIEPSTSSTQQPSTSSTLQPSTSSTLQPSTSSTLHPSTSSTQQPSTSSTQQPSTSSAEQLSRFRPPTVVNKRKRKMISVHEDILEEFRRSNEAAEDEMKKTNKLMEKSLEIQDKILDLLRNK